MFKYTEISKNLTDQKDIGFITFYSYDYITKRKKINFSNTKKKPKYFIDSLINLFVLMLSYMF